LKKPVLVTLNSPVILQKSTYNLKMKDFSEEDRKRLSKTIKLLHHQIPSIQESIFINADKQVITDHAGKRSKPLPDGNQRYRVKILIQGYKTSVDNIVSPVWRIKQGILYV
jgi:hypothetical protein